MPMWAMKSSRQRKVRHTSSHKSSRTRASSTSLSSCKKWFCPSSSTSPSQRQLRSPVLWLIWRWPSMWSNKAQPTLTTPNFLICANILLIGAKKRNAVSCACVLRTTWLNCCTNKANSKSLSSFYRHLTMSWRRKKTSSYWSNLSSLSQRSTTPYKMWIRLRPLSLQSRLPLTAFTSCHNCSLRLISCLGWSRLTRKTICFRTPTSMKLSKATAPWTTSRRQVWHSNSCSSQKWWTSSQMTLSI